MNEDYAQRNEWNFNMRIKATAIRLFVVNAGLLLNLCVGGAPSEASTATPACSTVNLSLGYGDRVSEMAGENALIFTLTNRGKGACHLYGHPGVSFYDSKGRELPFRYTWMGRQYVAQTAPKMVVLRPGARAYFLVAHYRCDIGIAMVAKTIRVYPPNTTQQLIGRVAPSVDVGGFTYCKGGSKDPGQLVAVSPVRATPRYL